MKITTLFLLLFAQIVSAQVSMPTQVKSLKDVTALVSKSVSGYRLERADTAVAKYKTVYLQYVADNKVIYVRFFKGDGFYEFNQISGSFDQMLIFWKQYVQPMATEKIKNIQQEVVMWPEKNKRFVFFKSGSEWVITVRS